MMSLPASVFAEDPLIESRDCKRTITVMMSLPASVFAYEWLLLNTAASASSFAMMRLRTNGSRLN
jgi:hypothetical protein